MLVRSSLTQKWPTRSSRAALVTFTSFVCLACQNAYAITNTLGIVVDTARAAPACMSWRPSGVCFWLKCTPFGCSVKTSLRISHYNPDAVISTYHDSVTHPWVDYGTRLATAVKPIGQSIAGLPIGSAGTRTRDDRRDRNKIYRDGDAIGHPVASLSFLLTGAFPTPTPPSSIGIPSVSSFASSFGVPGLSSLSSAVSLPALTSISGITSLSGYSNLMSAASMPSFGSVIGTGTMSGVTLFCPTPVTPFMPYHHSVVDSLTWRAILPIEMLYPAALIPGSREIGHWPINTWGGVFPRDGNVTQQHPVKAAAVLAQRIGDVVTRNGEPHVYYPLPTGGVQEIGGYRVWLPPPLKEVDASTGKWQMLSPAADRSCQVFGANDTVSPSSWGDGKTAQSEGYAFNLWRPYSCCSKAGQIFLFAIMF